MTDRLKVGVIGAGIIAQVMHLHHLRELNEFYDTVAICDLAPENGRSNADYYGIPHVFTDWTDLIAADLDAVFVLTSGSHASMAIAAAKAGKHVLVEKPMCFSAAEGAEMVAAAEAADVTLMVAYPKRYDPAFLEFDAQIKRTDDLRFFQVNTFESPFLPYVKHYRLMPPAVLPNEKVAALRAASAQALTAAIGTEDENLQFIYQAILLDSAIHEFNTIRAVLGEPDQIEYADLSSTGITVLMRFGAVKVSLHWMDLPGMTRYKMEFSGYSPDRRVTLTFPSPFLRNAPAVVSVEAGERGSVASANTTEVVSYESGFKRELMEFYECVTTGRPPVTDGLDGVRDVALCQAIIRSYTTGAPVDVPTALSGDTTA